MASNLRFAIAALAFALPACTTTTVSTTWPEAVPAASRYAAPIATTSAGGALTGRDWSCRSCYK